MFLLFDHLKRTQTQRGLCSPCLSTLFTKTAVPNLFCATDRLCPTVFSQFNFFSAAIYLKASFFSSTHNRLRTFIPYKIISLVYVRLRFRHVSVTPPATVKNTFVTNEEWQWLGWVVPCCMLCQSLPSLQMYCHNSFYS